MCALCLFITFYSVIRNNAKRVTQLLFAAQVARALGEALLQHSVPLCLKEERWQIIADRVFCKYKESRLIHNLTFARRLLLWGCYLGPSLSSSPKWSGCCRSFSCSFSFWGESPLISHGCKVLATPSALCAQPKPPPDSYIDFGQRLHWGSELHPKVRACYAYRILFSFCVHNIPGRCTQHSNGRWTLCWALCAIWGSGGHGSLSHCVVPMQQPEHQQGHKLSMEVFGSSWHRLLLWSSLLFVCCCLKLGNEPGVFVPVHQWALSAYRTVTVLWHFEPLV